MVDCWAYSKAAMMAAKKVVRMVAKWVDYLAAT